MTCRLQGADCFYHIVSRGDGRKAIYNSERDCEKFLEYVGKAKGKFPFYLHTYCLVTNYYHPSSTKRTEEIEFCF